MRPAACLSTQVQPLSHLLSRVGAAGTDSRRRKVELVEEFSIADL